MQRESVRMKAYAVSFDAIEVYLQTNYYNGISSKFYLKNMETLQSTLLAGDAEGESDGWRIYRLRAEFELGTSYQIMDAYGLFCNLDVTRLALTEQFDRDYYYAGNDLGSTYKPNMTVFKVWAPLATGVILKVYHGPLVNFYAMVRKDKGVYEIKIYRDLDGYEYTYLITHNDVSVETTDPYAYASTSNALRSIVINLERVDHSDYPLPPLRHMTDAIIYEVGVRDFSMDPYGGLRHKGKFLAFTERGNRTYLGYPSGVDYLADLGVTHIQLMPIQDFATVDEDHPYELYNWGYDPVQYNVTEGSFVTDPNDGYRRIVECQQMIKNIHRHGMRVVMDVVYNHMHDVNNNALEKTVPYYWFRRHEGKLSNGSWCGNDINSEGLMVRKYIVDMCIRWQTLYGVDGFRFDLMGLLDIKTIQEVQQECTAIDPSFIIYGEGWNMGTLPESRKASMDNHGLLPGIGFFNDYFRDTIRGTNQMETKGYVSGDTYKTNEAIRVLCDYEKFSSVEQSINYVECHDNATVYDKFSVSNVGEVESCIERRCLIALGAVLLAQGVPFIHAGEEFFGTKNGNGNSYNIGDSVNMISWGRRDQYVEQVNQIKFLIRLRKNNKCFRYYDFEDMRNHIHIYNCYHKMIEYHLSQDEGDYREFRVFINPSYDPLTVDIDPAYQVIFCMENEQLQDCKLTVRGVSMVICAK